MAKTIEEKIDALPDKIVVPNKNPIDEYDKEDWYRFELSKEGKEYEMSYYSALRDNSIVSFAGNLHEVVSKMYEWCKERQEC